MPRIEHLILCGGANRRDRAGARINLNLHGTSANVHLKIADISKPLLANIPDALIDLLEIASYIYAADGAISRGGPAEMQMGRSWRRKLRFVIPVRLPELWSSRPVASAIVEMLSFLSDDEYEIEFQSLKEAPVLATYFEFPEAEATSFRPDEVVLFSGGLDSFAGSIDRLLTHRKRLALVSHRSGTKIASALIHLVEQLRSRFGADYVLHIPVWATVAGNLSREYTHRTRSFLFAALGAVIAQIFVKDSLYIFENGVVSLNLPPLAQVVGARASRTTHPQVLAGFRQVLSNVLGCTFDVHNPFQWLTKTEVVARIASNGCADLIRDTRSCTRVRDMTRLHPHCGECSQCIDRRFAILAAGQEDEDPQEAYKIDLFRGARKAGPNRELALAFVRSASEVNRIEDFAFFARYGETSRVVGFFEEPADTVASRIFDLYRRHAATICRVFEEAIESHAVHLRERSLPASCLLVLSVSQSEAGGIYPLPTDTTEPVSPMGPSIVMAIDAAKGLVVFSEWGELKGAGAGLIIALAGPFRDAMLRERAPQGYQFTMTVGLVRQLKGITEEALRRRVARCRNAIAQLAKRAGHPPPSPDAVIESNQWHGYRLNPDRVRLVAISELS